MKRIPIIYSTITGNAFKLADAIKSEVPNYLGPYNIRYVNDEIINEFDTFVILYWCNKGTLDQDSLDLISKLSNKKIFILGTMGSSPSSPYGHLVFNNVNKLVSQNNELIGNYLCQGAIDMNRTYKRTKLPKDSRGYLPIEMWEQQKESLTHPDSLDLYNAKEAVKKAFNK